MINNKSYNSVFDAVIFMLKRRKFLNYIFNYIFHVFLLDFFIKKIAATSHARQTLFYAFF